jgi:hypothetical protein
MQTDQMALVLRRVVEKTSLLVDISLPIDQSKMVVHVLHSWRQVTAWLRVSISLIPTASYGLYLQQHWQLSSSMYSINVLE